MSLRLPSRRLLQSASTLSPPLTTTALLPAMQALAFSSPSHNRRPFHTTPTPSFFWRRNKNKVPEAPGPLDKNSTTDARTELMNSLTSRVEGPSIFQDEVQDAVQKASTSAPTLTGDGRPPGPRTSQGASLVREHMSRAIDPDPRSRVRWQRKMAIRHVQTASNPFSKEPRAARIARTERQFRQKSAWLATSTKKLVHLARQIQGKPLDVALAQMRYSKKKMAQEVRVQLEEARDMAVVERGMGLGAVKGQLLSHPEEFQTKDGKWIKVSDPTAMYVAEAWVNKGPIRAKEMEARARGRTNVLKSPSTSISIVLKEEKTRMREFVERKAKQYRQGPWVHLPDRPVTAQRPYYSW